MIPLNNQAGLPRSLRIVLLNDVGFIGGAGVALRRQAQSLLLGGHSVAVVCWLNNPQSEPPSPRGSAPKGQWLGLHAKPEIHIDQLGSNPAVAARIAKAVLDLRPDAVIAGNLHWAKWPIETFDAIRSAGIPQAAYLHDCHWLTGRCAYTGACRKFETGCDASCPTPSEYPVLDPASIARAYEARRRMLAGPNALPLVANSRWMKDMAERAFHNKVNVDLLPLGLDTHLFAPIDRKVARTLLGLPQDKFIVLVGAVDLSEPRKGGPLLKGVLDVLASQSIIQVIGFGHQSEHIAGLRALGHIDDERLMPVIYSAADVFLNCAAEESFGQTVLEASACGTPVIAFRVGGVPDIIKSPRMGVLIDRPEPGLFAKAIFTLIRNPDQRNALATEARRSAEEHFSLEAQCIRWQEYLSRRFALR